MRTKDWVARWKAPGAPGKFQLLVNGAPLKETFGTRGAEWFWQPGGTVEIKTARGPAGAARSDRLRRPLRRDPLHRRSTLSSRRTIPRRWRPGARDVSGGLPEQPAEEGPFDLVVVGGGYAGSCAAVSAARMGCRVALIQDRPVLGGNGSSEIRVWPQGLTPGAGLFPRLGEIVEELVDRPSQSPGPAERVRRRQAGSSSCARRRNITLFLNHYVFQVETNGGRIVAVVALDTRTGRATRFAGKLFADCTGHGTHRGCWPAPTTPSRTKGHMGMSNMWRWKNADEPQTFPETPWALDLAMKDFPYPSEISRANGSGKAASTRTRSTTWNTCATGTCARSSARSTP